ncbi:MAG: YciI family protein [Acidobacteriota bacterium]
MNTYVLLLNYEPAAETPEPSPEEMQAIVEKYVAWGERMADQGRWEGGKKLGEEGGRVVRRDGEKVTATDGPFAEAKEVVGGFSLLKAESYDEVVELLQDHPHLEGGGTILVREVDPIEE